MEAGDCVLAEIFQSLVLGCMKFQSLIMYLIQVCYICIWAADVSYIAQEKVPAFCLTKRGRNIFYILWLIEPLKVFDFL